LVSVDLHGRELGRRFVGGRIGAVDADREPIGDVVEAVPERVGDLADEQRKDRVGWLGVNVDSQALLASLRISLVDDAARFCIRPPVDCHIESVQVFHRPAELRERTSGDHAR
jgi:hypothetical protein